MQPTKILILTADAGFGHRSAANALCQAFDLRYGDAAHILIVNPLDEPGAPPFMRGVESDYDRLARDWPQFYKLGYKMSDLSLTTSVTEMAYVVLMYEIISRLMKLYQPDVVVVTFPTYQYPVAAYRRLSGDYVPIATVVTDLVSLQKMWFSQSADRGLDPAAIHVTGLPVNPALAGGPSSKAEARRALGWPEDKFTVLAVGSKRVERLHDFTHVLNHAGFDLHLAAVAGGNETLYQALQSEEWHIPATVYDFVDNMPDLMHAADCIVSKAGGLIVTESLACGLPLLITQIIPGQETGNARLVVDEGAGDVTLEPLTFLETMAHWLVDDGRLYRQRAENARRLGRPDSAVAAVDLIWQAAQNRTSEPGNRFPISRSTLKALLRQFGGSEKPATP
jgi:1,2-diacylglycerol 3-beta-galactosyltransferase